jgi:hypothetical protein
MQEITLSAPCGRFYVGEHPLTRTEILLLLRHYMRLFNLVHLKDEFSELHVRRFTKNLKNAHILVTLAE